VLVNDATKRLRVGEARPRPCSVHSGSGGHDERDHAERKAKACRFLQKGGHRPISSQWIDEDEARWVGLTHRRQQVLRRSGEDELATTAVQRETKLCPYTAMMRKN
jgi:hypothetical protein